MKRHPTGPRTSREDIDAETVVEDARPYFGGDNPSEPDGEADAPPPG